jgi:hypothetical protein
MSLNKFGNMYVKNVILFKKIRKKVNSIFSNFAFTLEKICKKKSINHNNCKYLLKAVKNNNRILIIILHQDHQIINNNNNNNNRINFNFQIHFN